MGAPWFGSRSLQLLLVLVSLGGAPWLPAAPPRTRAGVAHGRRLQREVRRRQALRRYGTSSTAMAKSAEVAVRYPGLMPLRRLDLTPEDCGFDPPEITCFSLATEVGRLIAPGLLSLDLQVMGFPAGPVRDPLEALEVYQELRHDRGWIQLLPLLRDTDRRRLEVLRDDFGTGRFAIAWRMHQPVNLLEVYRRPSSQGPQLVYVHGTDGTRSDYWGPRDVLASATCFASSVYLFQYPTGLPIASNARALRDALARIPPARGQRRVLVGFSMGGLVARYALERLGRRPRVDDLVLLATPNHGDRLLATAGHLPGLSRTLIRALEAWPGLTGMLPGSEFLELLNYPVGPLSPRTLGLMGQVDFSGDLVVGVNSAQMPRGRRPAEYDFVRRQDFLNLDRLSHWGAHQEFRVNGFEEDLLAWLGLEADPECTLDRQRARTTPVTIPNPLRGRAAANPVPGP